MSSYLTIYMKLKDSDKKVELNSWSRNNEIYQQFYEVVHPAWAGDEDKYTDITESHIDEMIADCNKEIENCKKIKKSYKERQQTSNQLIVDIASKITDKSNLGVILELIRHYQEENDYTIDIESQNELIEDYEWCKNQLYFIRDILNNVKYVSNPDIVGLCCNID